MRFYIGGKCSIMKPMLKKPVRRNENIKMLSREHHLSLIFCWKIRQGLKADVHLQRISKYVRYFWQQHFDPHFRVEEEFLFSRLTDRLVYRAIEEHKRICQKVQDLENYPINNLRKRLAELADIVDEHVRYEERELFPHLERKLSAEELEDVGRRIEKHHPLSFNDKYEDQFWNTL